MVYEGGGGAPGAGATYNFGALSHGVISLMNHKNMPIWSPSYRNIFLHHCDAFNVTVMHSILCCNYTVVTGKIK